MNIFPITSTVGVQSPEMLFVEQRQAGMDVEKVLAYKFIQHWTTWDLKAMLELKISNLSWRQVLHVCDFQKLVEVKRDVYVGHRRSIIYRRY